MEVIAISRPAPGTIRAWVRDDTVYRHYELSNKGYFREIMEPLPVRTYATYEHFTMVMSKFAPEVEFFRRPVKIAKLTRDALLEIVISRGIQEDSY